jgi:phosphoenolpyruvate synthase/pyruvate phosphate dikinase
MILSRSTDSAERRRALAGVMPLQKSDFAQLFRIMRDKPVTIRLLDPPLYVGVTCDWLYLTARERVLWLSCVLLYSAC